VPVGFGSSSALVVRGKGGDYRDGDGDHPQEENGAYSKSRGRMELLNLECSINNDNTGAGKARFVFFSGKCSMGFRF
jgi:hypothetical protein